MHDLVQIVGVQIRFGHRYDEPDRLVAAYGHRGDPVRCDRPVVELGGELLLASSGRVTRRACGAPRRGVTIGNDMNDPIDRFVMKDLVEGTEARCRVVAWRHEEAEAMQSGRASGTAFQHRRTDL